LLTLSALALTSALALALSLTAANAAGAEDAAYDKGGQPIYSGFGNCVRTQWQDDNDPCAPKPAPKVEAPVAEAKPEPKPEPAPEPVPQVSLEARTIYFDFNKANLDDEDTAKLDELAKIINDSDSIADVRIHGFTDQIGSDDANKTLAGKRADAVKTYLDGKSRLSATVAEVKGLGKASPQESCAKIKKRTEKIDCMKAERRVEIEFKATKK
jgi:OOP family OmpA-OmpF porin